MHFDSISLYPFRSQRRKSAHLKRAFLFLLFLSLINGTHAQQPSSLPPPQGTSVPLKTLMQPTSPSLPALTRTIMRHEVRRFGYGGMLTLYGAPQGSINIESWTRNEVDVTAEIELRAETEADLDKLAAVNSFILDTDNTHLTLLTTGTHDRKFMKRVARDFPKKLLALPWKIDYHIRLPASTDLDIFAGNGPLAVANVEGALHINAGQSQTTFTLSGGDVSATIASGAVLMRIPSHNWRGHGASIRLLQGDLTVELPASFNADIDADVLRTGRIENTYTALTPREQFTQSERTMRVRAGGGGPTLSFTVGDGTLRIKAAASDK